MVRPMGVQLTHETLTRETAVVVAAELDSLTCDLAEAIIESETTCGATRESGMAKAMLEIMDERLQWVHRNYADDDLPHLEQELKSIQQNASDGLALIQHGSGVRVERTPSRRERWDSDLSQ